MSNSKPHGKSRESVVASGARQNMYVLFKMQRKEMYYYVTVPYGNNTLYDVWNEYPITKSLVPQGWLTEEAFQKLLDSGDFVHEILQGAEMVRTSTGGEYTCSDSCFYVTKVANRNKRGCSFSDRIMEAVEKNE